MVLGYLRTEWWLRPGCANFNIGKWAINCPAWSWLDSKVNYSFYYLFGPTLFTYRTHNGYRLEVLALWRQGTTKLTLCEGIQWRIPIKKTKIRRFPLMRSTQTVRLLVICDATTRDVTVMDQPSEQCWNIKYSRGRHICFSCRLKWMALNDSTLSLPAQTSWFY